MSFHESQDSSLTTLFSSLTFFGPLNAFINLFINVLKFPEHPSTRADIALLSICVGHFARLEFATDAEVSVSFVAECATLARNFVSTARFNTFRPPSRPSDGTTIDGDCRSSEPRTEREMPLGHLDVVNDPAHHEYDVSLSLRIRLSVGLPC